MIQKEVYITDYNCITPLGFDVEKNIDELLQEKTAIKKYNNYKNIGSLYGSIVSDELLDQKFAEVSSDSHYTKLEKMMILALEPIIKINKVNQQSAFVFSTTKGNIQSLENKENPISDAHLGALAQKIALYFGFKTEPIVVSNACVSGLLAVAVANRMIKSGVYTDAFIVAGDIVSEFVLSGFSSFQAMSDEPCKPYDKNRKGVTLGEATAAVYVTADKNKINKNSYRIIGDAAMNDANHISGPSRTGEGLYRSIICALQEGEVSAQQVDFISAHGTATLYNDEMEAIAFNRAGLQNVPVSSFKGFYGHTLGASGLLETVITIASANQNQLIASKGFEEQGVSKKINIVTKNTIKTVHRFLKTASGFGGCNTAVLFEKVR